LRASKEEVRDAAKERKRERKWLKMLADLRGFRDGQSQTFAARVRKGIPDSCRARAWLYLIHPPAQRFDAAGVAGKPGQKPSIKSPLITRLGHYARKGDIPTPGLRTIPGLLCIETTAAQESLHKLIRAYLHADRSARYHANMGVIPSLFLSYMPEGRAFFAFLYLMVGRKRLVRDYFDPASLEVLGRIWERLLTVRMKDVKDILDYVQIKTDEYLPTWLQTAFLTVPIDPRTRLRIFDRFVAFGTRALFSVGLVIMFGLRQIMFSSDKEALLKRLRGPESDPGFKNYKATIDQLDRLSVTSIEFKKLKRSCKGAGEDEDSYGADN
jgi:hypothetical protein